MWSTKINLAWAAHSTILLLSQSTASNAAVLPRQSTSGSSLKAGLGWGGGGNISQFEGHQVGWYFTWSPTSWVTPPPALEYVPQLWGGRDATLFARSVNTSSVTLSGVKNVLGMNEPQEPSQANLSPQDAAAMWKTYLEPLKAAGVRLGSPATTSAPNGKTWLQDFLTACDGCSVDFIALHWYGNVAAEFTTYLEDFHNTFQRPIWVTEWSCLNFAGGAQCTNDEMTQFMKTTQAYMDQASWVERYAWFGAMANLPAGVPNNFTALMDPSGIINPLGQQYIGPLVGSTPPPATSTTSISSAAPTSSPAPTISATPVATTTLATTASATETTITTTLTTTLDPQSTTSTRSSSAPATTTSPYVIISRAPTKHRSSYLAILFSTLLVCGSWLL
ncbi:hypothetical protein FRC07_015008 [Ceratobasidium sp. 392]|nr:hypothetical protein FRC07_015008 [Ceratobasidium sp. 392]